MVKFNIQLDSSYNSSFCRNPPIGGAYNVVLAANTEDSISIPVDAKFAIFAYNLDTWVKVDGTAAILATNVEDGTGSELNPSAYSVDGYSTISFIAADATLVSVSFYS